MAEAAATNAFMNSGRNVYLQFNSISITNRYGQFQPYHNTIISSRQAILALAVTVLLNFLQVKCEGNDKSPFESYPVLMIIALTSLLVYCLSYDFTLRISATRHHSTGYTYFLSCCIAFFGPLSLAALSSTLFPSSVSPFFFTISVLFSLCQVPLSLVRKLWDRLRVYFRYQLHRQEEQEETTRGQGLVSVLRLAWISESAAENLVDDALPPV